MRIRNFRFEDMPTLLHIQQAAAQADEISVLSEDAFVAWLTDPAHDALANAFVITDDDDEVNTWGQAGTLEGVEGEIVGYTLVQLRQELSAYHFVCQGTVHPAYRHMHAGRALFICALNCARMLAAEFEFEAEQAGVPVYFEALLPERDMFAAQLAARCEMLPTTETTAEGLRLYRREL